MTSVTERQRLLRIARQAIEAHVTGTRTAGRAPSEATPRCGAAFVSLHRRGELRGCIGHLDVSRPLGLVVAECAVAACSADPRFAPVGRAELVELAIEVSLLGDFEPIAGAAEVEIGRHGLMVEDGWRRGLLLPQVATEWQWDAETFLAHTCHKAGLPQDAWRGRASVWRFEAEVFSDET
jgi:AmmeMemoRadiSam system protein A